MSKKRNEFHCLHLNPPPVPLGVEDVSSQSREEAGVTEVCGEASVRDGGRAQAEAGHHEHGAQL